MKIEPTSSNLVKIEGTVSRLRCTRKKGSFVLTPADQDRMRIVAVGAALVGATGAALTTASNASDVEEEADYVEFDLDEIPIKGWLWRSPFQEGDNVEVVGRWKEDHYEAIGLARPSDRTIALFPHCSRGRVKHYRNAVKVWFFGTLCNLALCLIVCPMIVGFNSTRAMLFEENGLLPLALFSLYGVIAINLTRKWMPFVRTAEQVFATLGWQEPQKVDLVKSSKAQRKRGDRPELGVFYFRF